MNHVEALGVPHASDVNQRPALPESLQFLGTHGCCRHPPFRPPVRDPPQVQKFAMVQQPPNRQPHHERKYDCKKSEYAEDPVSGGADHPRYKVERSAGGRQIAEPGRWRAGDVVATSLEGVGHRPSVLVSGAP